MIPKKLRLLGEAPAGWPDASRVLLCEGLPKPMNNAFWRVVGWLEQPVPSHAGVERWIRELKDLERKRRAYRRVPMGPEERKRLDAEIRIAKVALEEARGAERATVQALPIDPKLGSLVVPENCKDVEFRR